jgi:hypothetical protein
MAAQQKITGNQWVIKRRSLLAHFGAFWRILPHFKPRRDFAVESRKPLVAVGETAIYKPIIKGCQIRHSPTSGPALVFIHKSGTVF